MSIRTKKIKFNDQAFIKNNIHSFILNGYYAGKLVLNISFENMVCVDGFCMQKDEFNARYLHYSYEDDFLLKIMNAQKLSNIRSRGDDKNFIQKNTHIEYEVKNGSIRFKDAKNHILIRLKPMP